jgi:Zinc knuckle
MMANPTGTNAGTHRRDTQASQAARRQSFIDAEVTTEQVRQYLLEANTYEQFIELVQAHVEEALPVLWACREEWAEAQRQPDNHKGLEELRAELATRTTERDAAVRENNLLNELLNAYRNAPAQRAVSSIEDPAPAALTPTPSQEQLRGQKSSKIPDPPVFKDGLTPTFDTWKRAVRNKLRSNADHYPTEEAKLGYVLSRVEQPASDILEPYLDDDAATPFTTHIQVFEALERVYGVPNKEYLYQGQFELLEQGNTDLNAFVAEFYRLSAPLRRDEGSLLNSFRRKLSPTMQRLTIGRQNDSLEDLIEFCRRVDDDLKIQQQSRRNVSSTPSSRASRPATRTVSPSTPTAPTPTRTTTTPAPARTALDPNSFVRSQTPKTNTTYAEREQLKAQGLCFQCKQPGHLASDCPQRNPRVNVVDEQEEMESEN